MSPQEIDPTCPECGYNLEWQMVCEHCGTRLASPNGDPGWVPDDLAELSADYRAVVEQRRPDDPLRQDITHLYVKALENTLRRTRGTLNELVRAYTRGLGDLSDPRDHPALIAARALLKVRGEN